MEAVAKEVLPPGYTFAWSGLAVRGEAIGRHVGARVRVRPHHRVPGARRAVRIVDAARRGDDGGAVRHPGRAPHQPPARPRQRRVLPDRPPGADRPRRQERRAARVRGGRLPQAGQVDHGSDDPRRRAAAAADHHDLARVRDRLPAARARRRRRRQRAAFDRHRHHRRHAGRDDARDAVRAAVLLHLRPAEGARRGEGEGGAGAENAPAAPAPAPAAPAPRAEGD